MDQKLFDLLEAVYFYFNLNIKTKQNKNKIINKIK